MLLRLSNDINTMSLNLFHSSQTNKRAPSEETTSTKLGMKQKLFFPERLYEILEDVELNGDAGIISWMPHGRAFRVHDPKSFVETIMTSKFRQTKWPSFQRQLHIYGFVRITQGPDKGAYYNKMFLRGKKELLSMMTLTKIKGTKVRMAVDRLNEPNFYAMPPVNKTREANTVHRSPSLSQDIPQEICFTKEANPSQDLPRKICFSTKAAKQCDSYVVSKEAEASSWFKGSVAGLLTAEFLQISDDPQELNNMFDSDGVPDSLDNLPVEDGDWDALIATIIDVGQVPEKKPVTMWASSA